MNVLLDKYVYIYIDINTSICTRLYICMYQHVCMYVCMYVCVLCVYMKIKTHTVLYIYIDVSTYMTDIHIYIYYTLDMWASRSHSYKHNKEPACSQVQLNRLMHIELYKPQTICRPDEAVYM